MGGVRSSAWHLQTGSVSGETHVCQGRASDWKAWCTSVGGSGLAADVNKEKLAGAFKL